MASKTQCVVNILYLIVRWDVSVHTFADIYQTFDAKQTHQTLARKLFSQKLHIYFSLLESKGSALCQANYGSYEEIWSVDAHSKLQKDTFKITISALKYH